MNTWKPISLEELNKIIANDLIKCDSEQKAVWSHYSVKPYKAQIERYGLVESVFIVANKESQAMYYEDVEEGFNFSPLGKNGEIMEHWCNQDELYIALNRWLKSWGEPLWRCPTSQRLWP